MTINKRPEIDRREVPGFPGIYALASGDIPEVPLTLRDDGRLEVRLFGPNGEFGIYLRSVVVVAAFLGIHPNEVGFVRHLSGTEFLTDDRISNLELSDHDETDDVRPMAKLSNGVGGFIEYEIEYHDDPEAYTITEAKPKKRRIQ